MSRRIFILLAVVLAVLILGPALARGAGPPVLDSFLQKNGLTGIFRSRPLVQAMAGRWEAAASSGGYLYGLAAYHHKNHPAKQSLMASFCRLAVLRQKMKPLETRINQKTKDGLWAAEALRLAVVECRIRNFRVLGLDRSDGWSICACRVRPEGITLPHPLPEPETYLARAGYNLGKTALKKGNQAAALEWFKTTRTDPAVYGNSLAFLVPLIHARDADLSARVDREFLRLDRVDDPEALAYLAGFRVSGQQPEAAQETCRRCLELDSGNEQCAAILDSLNQTLMDQGLAYENFFSTP